MIDAAIECNVPYVVHISGTDVTIGYDPIYYGSENTTFIPKKHLLGAYSRTKYESEQIVADSNGRSLSNGTFIFLDFIFRFYIDCLTL